MTEEQQLLQSASIEIKQLRNENQLMSARLDTFDSIMLLFRTEPNYGNRGMTEDLVWKIEKYLTREKEPHPISN
jgi:hypothetical protein